MTRQADLDLLGVLVRRRKRLREIGAVLRRYGLTGFADHVETAAGSRLPPGSQRLIDAVVDADIEAMSTGERVRGALTDLGTTAVKLGQLLSLRPDLVGPEIADELRLLRSGVPADVAGHGGRTVEADLGRPADELFTSFDPEPMASGSVGSKVRGRHVASSSMRRTPNEYS